MREMTNVTDIFKLPKTTRETVCVTTNANIKTNGHAVMGRGIALVANQRFNLSRDLAWKLYYIGNFVHDMGVRKDAKTGNPVRIFTYPTKHNWREPSDLAQIRLSAERLVKLCDQENITTCYLPRPGCTNGGLDWETQVKPILEPILDDRFVVTDYE